MGICSCYRELKHLSTLASTGIHGSNPTQIPKDKFGRVKTYMWVLIVLNHWATPVALFRGQLYIYICFKCLKRVVNWGWVRQGTSNQTLSKHKLNLLSRSGTRPDALSFLSWMMHFKICQYILSPMSIDMFCITI